MSPTVTETLGRAAAPYRHAKVSGIGCRVDYDAVDRGMTCNEESQTEPDGYTVGHFFSCFVSVMFTLLGYMGVISAFKQTSAFKLHVIARM